MRLLLASALSTTLAAAFLAGCSSGSGSHSPSASIPGSGLAPRSVRTNSAHGRILSSSIPEQLMRRAKFGAWSRSPAAYTRGIAVDIFNYEDREHPHLPEEQQRQRGAVLQREQRYRRASTTSARTRRGNAGSSPTGSRVSRSTHRPLPPARAARCFGKISAPPRPSGQRGRERC